MPFHSECDVILLLMFLLLIFIALKTFYVQLLVPICQYYKLNIGIKESGMNYYIALTILYLSLYQTIKA